MLRLNFGNPRPRGKGELVFLVKLENLATKHFEFALVI